MEIDNNMRIAVGREVDGEKGEKNGENRDTIKN